MCIIVYVITCMHVLCEHVQVGACESCVARMSKHVWMMCMCNGSARVLESASCSMCCVSVAQPSAE